MFSRALSLTMVLLLHLTACSDGGNSSGGSPGTRIAMVTDFEAYDWNEVPAGARWEPRAGLQALELDDKFYLFGCRIPRPPSMPAIPGNSDI